MVIVSVDEAQRGGWPNYLDRVQCDEAGYFFRHPEASCISLEYPKMERLPFFARYLSTLEYGESDFNGGSFWRTAWGVWNYADEAVGYRLVEKLSIAAGQPCSFEAKPGCRFRADELTEAIGLLMQPMIFGWDAFFLPTFAYGVEEFFLFVSHDSHVNVVTRTKAFYDRTMSNLESMGLGPQLSPPNTSSRFCRQSPV